MTVKPGETIGTLAAQMRGVEKQMDVFRLLNGLRTGAGVSAGDKVKIVTDL